MRLTFFEQFRNREKMGHQGNNRNKRPRAQQGRPLHKIQPEDPREMKEWNFQTGCLCSNHVFINLERNKRGIPLLVRLPELDQAAREHARAMADKDALFYSDKSRIFEKSSKSFPVLAENIAYGESTMDVHAVMMKCTEERNNILDEKYLNMGTGTAIGQDGILFVCYIFSSHVDENNL